MKKRAISLLLALCLCIALLPTTALAAGNPYPNYNYYNSASDYQIACTWYAWQQAYDRQGIALPIWGNGGDWFNSASGSGYSTGSTPTVGAIACWSATNTPPYGHVAYVTGVNGDGSFSLIEGGSGWSGASAHGVCSRTISHGLYWPDQGFIYLGSSGNSSPAVAFSPWSKNGYTYIGETDAAIGQLVTVSNGNCTETGMYLYDANGNVLASAKNPTYTLPQIYFQINAECGYTLTPGTTYKYKFYAVVNGKTYWSNEQSFKTSGIFVPKVPDCGVVEDEPTITFKPWENANYTYIRETDAAIGQEILVSNGTCGENGIYLYDVNENFLASAKNPTYTLPQIYFQMNAECGYTLTPGTTYKYKFYAVVDGEYYWSDWGTFKTTGTAPAANYSISLNRSSLSMTVGDEAALSATVSPAGPAVTWKSSNETVVKVVNGNVTAVKAGSATITATAAGKTATCKVTVTAATTPDPVPTPGSGSREQEPNDTIVTANPVSLNTAVTGNLYKTSDKDWFEFTLPSAGMVQLSFGHEYVDLDSDCWRTYLYTAENKEIVYFQWKGNATVTEQSGQIGLEAGTYYVCVTKTPAYRYDVDYQLTVNFTASNTWETEFNDTVATADPMALNTKYSGSIMNSRDEDWYVFTLPSSETVQLVFGNEPVTTFGNNWRTTIYTSEKKKVVSSTWRGDATTDQTSDKCSLAAGTYYLCVEGMIGNRKDETYWITIKTAAGNQPDSGDIVAPFTDVKASAYYAEPVKWAVDHGVTVGTSATTFSPDATCTNAQILTFIWRAAGFPEPAVANPFTNLSGSEYYAKAAVWAYSMGMVSGTAFDANKACTRAMTMEYLWKQAGSPAVAASGKFTDVPSSAAYATAVAWAVNNGITAGTSNTTFSPDSICTRGQIMTFLYRAEG